MPSQPPFARPTRPAGQAAAGGVQARFRQALQLIGAGRLAEARPLLETLQRQAPKAAEIPFQLARLDMAARDPAGAAERLARAEALKPGTPAIIAALAEALAEAGREDQAIAAYDRWIALEPRAVKPLADKALCLQRLGRFEDAEAVFVAALDLAPLDGELYRMLIATRKIAADDPVIGRMRAADRDGRMGAMPRAHLHFALAKALEDAGDYPGAWGYLARANAGMRAAQPFDMDQRVAEVDRLLSLFDEDGLAGLAPEGEVPPGTFHPIFVTGMPRSGTTLAEQILASHSAVTGAGELGLATPLAEKLMLPKGFAPRPLSALSRAKLDGFAAEYESALRRRFAFDRAITDKSIQSFLVIGLLLKAMPGARVAVLRRDPRDMLLSIYKNVFAAGTHRYAYDLQDLARYYAHFLKVMDFWRQRLPGGFHELSYDALVADPEPHSRALVKAAGLGWEDACLAPQKAKRQVTTLSLHQVRQPIYRSSSQAWRRYETELAPLFAALEAEGVMPE